MITEYSITILTGFIVSLFGLLIATRKSKLSPDDFTLYFAALVGVTFLFVSILYIAIEPTVKAAFIA